MHIVSSTIYYKFIIINDVRWFAFH